MLRFRLGGQFAVFTLALMAGCGGAYAQAPAAPTGVSATAGNNQISLFWNAVSGNGRAVTYNIYIGLSAGGEGTTANVTGLKTPSWATRAPPTARLITMR